jgi:hypothetical protein
MNSVWQKARDFPKIGIHEFHLRGGIQGNQRWARLLKSSSTVYCLPTKEIKLPFLFPFAANKWKFAVSVSRLQQKNGYCRFPFFLYFYAAISKGKRKKEVQAISLIRLPIAYPANGSLSFVDKETNRIYPFANGLNGTCPSMLVIHKK